VTRAVALQNRTRFPWAQAAKPTPEILAAGLLEPGVEFLQRPHLGHGDQKVRPAVAHHALDHSLLVAACGQAEVLPEEVVALQLQKPLGETPFPSSQHPRDGHP